MESALLSCEIILRTLTDVVMHSHKSSHTCVTCVVTCTMLFDKVTKICKNKHIPCPIEAYAYFLILWKVEDSTLPHNFMPITLSPPLCKSPRPPGGWVGGWVGGLGY